MKFRLQLIILLYTLFFLFYPGNSYYVNLFFNSRQLFAEEEKPEKKSLSPVPYVINPYIKPDITAAGAYIVDIDSFTPIFSKRSHDTFLPASTTKVVSALVAFDNYQLDEVVTVKRVISAGQIMGLVPGEKITVENLLYGLLVHSGNDAAFALADHFPGGEKKFVTAMNEKAKALYMQKTIFKNPAGLDDFGQHTTAYDLALAGRELLANKTLAKIVSIKSITVSDVDFRYFHSLRNVNKLLGEIAGIGGLKTGRTLDAGENLITFYKHNSNQFLIVILKSEDRFEDTKKIVNWIDSNIGYINLR